MSNHEFFRNFGYKRMEPAQLSVELQHNLFVMEIYNNWDYVVKLMRAHKEGTLGNKKLDQLDQY